MKPVDLISTFVAWAMIEHVAIPHTPYESSRSTFSVTFHLQLNGLFKSTANETQLIV
jgi:hypothetical protein